MVLITNKLFFIISIFLFNTTLVFSDYFTDVYISGLLQYGANIDRQRLELLESRQIIYLSAAPNDTITSTYTIRNSGDAYQATLGILIYQFMGEDIPPAALEIQFSIDGNHLDHAEIVNDRRVTIMDGNEQELEMGHTSWALFEVLFPENSTIIVQVQHRYASGYYPTEVSMGGYFFSYNTKYLSFFPDLLYWRGSTKFSMEVINNFVQSYNVEARWIYDIFFERMTGDDLERNWADGNLYVPFQDILSTREHLIEFEALGTNLMKIQRLNSNTFRIDFTEEFTCNFARSFIIGLNAWGGEGGGHFLSHDSSGELMLGFLEHNRNISQRELAPYELVFLTNSQLRVIRNAFFARYGFIFRSEDLQRIFRAVRNVIPPNPNFTEDMLTEIDRANIATIQRLETLAKD